MCIYTCIDCSEIVERRRKRCKSCDRNIKRERCIVRNKSERQRKIVSTFFTGKPGKGGRKKGGHNSKPYPMTEKVLERNRKHPPPYPTEATKEKLAFAAMKFNAEGRSGWSVYYKGRFSPKNPQKYVGNLTNIIYRSSWEARVMKYFDEHPNVLEWSSEETVIYYESPLDGRRHRYFIDFYAKMKDKDGKITKYIIEVKPDAQTRPPEVQPYKKKPSKRYVEAVMKWGVNEAKWNAAREYCKDRGLQFTIITEKDLRLWS